MPRQKPPVSLDVANATLWRGAQRVGLRPKELDVLRCLIEARGRLVDKAVLMDAAWPGVIVTDGVLKACINRLRAALGDDARTPRFIETVHRRGYRLAGEIEMRETSSRPTAPPRIVGHGARPDPESIRIVGRQAEVARLAVAFARATASDRQVVFVAGETGLGKTALIGAFLETLAGARVGGGQCVEHYGPGEAFQPVLEVLGDLCRGRRGRPLVAHLARHAPTWLAQIPGLLAPAAFETLAGRVAGVSRDRMLRELADAVDVLAAARPLVLVLEDLHWSDVSTLDLLGVLARRRAPARLLVVGTYRPEDVVPGRHPLPALVRDLSLHGLAGEIRLGPLAEGGVADYLASRFPGAELPADLARTVHRRTDGQPLFLVALAEHWVAHGMLAETSGRWRLRAGLEQLEGVVPTDVRQMIEIRLGRLTATQRRLVEAGSVAGVEFAAASVAAALGASLADTDEGFADLARRRLFLQACGEEVWPDGTAAGRYEFVHALYRDVIYEQVAVARRIELHRRVAKREEDGHGVAAARIAARLAMHAEHAHDYRSAARHRLQSARNAVDRGGYHEAIAHASAGLDALDRLPAERATMEQAIDLRLQLRQALMPLGEQRQLFDQLRRAETLAEVLNDRPRLCRVSSYLAEYHRQSGAPSRGVEYAERALALATAVGEVPLEALANYFLGTVCLDVGDYRRALVCLRQNVTGLTGDWLHERFGTPGIVSVMSRSRLCSCAAELGEFSEGAIRGEEAVRLAESVDQQFSLAVACFGVGDLALRRGDLPAAIRALERAAGLCRAASVPQWLPTVAAALGQAHALRGHPAEALPLLEQAVEQAASMGVSAMQSRRLAYLSAASLQDGQVEKAMSLAEDALRLARDLEARGYEAWALCNAGDVHADPRSRNAEAAEPYYRQGLALAEKLGMRPLQAHCHLGLGRLFYRLRSVSRARRELAVAIELFRALDMTFWLARAEAELAHAREHA
jgi:DNA-binding winged helix-turn-helix (wHTH) protein/tetratricopeptide (TPR) repeat protein